MKRFGIKPVFLALAVLLFACPLMPGLHSSQPLEAASIVSPGGWAPMDSDTTHDLHGVWGSSSSNVIAVGGYRPILTSCYSIIQYNGTAWSSMASGTGFRLYDVWGHWRSTPLFQETLFAVGEGGTILRYYSSALGGTIDWAPMTVPWANSDYYGVWGSSSSNVYAVGRLKVSGNDYKWMLHYDGNEQREWSQVWTYLPVGVLYGVWGTSSTNVFVVGDLGAIWHYDGSWDSMDSGTPNTLRGVWGTSDGSTVFAVGDSGTILRHNYTDNWSHMTSGVPPTVTLHGIWGTSASDVYAVGSSGTILHYDGNAGGTWLPMDSGSEDVELRAVWGSSGSNIFAVGDSGTILHGLEIPSITSINPDRGSQGQSLFVTITGTYLGAVYAVNFGENITVNSFTANDTEVTANITIESNATPGPRKVYVTTAAGVAEADFEVLVLPVIERVVPPAVLRGQTVPVTIEGYCLSGARDVDFGDGITVNSSTATDTVVTANITIDPDATPGPRNVGVTTDAGTGTGYQVFEVMALPEITVVDPGQAAQGQTLTITITGNYLDAIPTSVDFGAGIETVSDSLDVKSTTELEVDIQVASDANLGARDVKVTTRAGESPPLTFTVVEPSQITSLSPAEAAQGQSVTVTIAGSRLTGTTAVNLGTGITVSSPTVVSDTQITVAITIASDADPGARDVLVTTPGGVFTKAAAFTVLPLPVISSIDPAEAAQGQSITVTITGSHLSGATVVDFGPGISVADDPTVTDTQITATIIVASDATPGSRDVAVTTGAGTDTQVAAFAVLEKPVITPTQKKMRTNDRTPTLEGSITDAAGLVAGIQYRVGDSPSWLPADLTWNGTTGSYTFTTSLLPGTHNVQIRAVDSSGNIVGDVATVQVTIGKRGISAWVIVLAVIGGLLVLAAIGYVIWRYRTKIKEKSREKVGEAREKVRERKDRLGD